MQQLTFVLDENNSAAEMVQSVTTNPAYENASCRLQIVFEPNCEDYSHIRRILQQATEELATTHTVGMTLMGPIGPTVRVPSHPICTFLLFEHSDATVYTYDCHDLSPVEAGSAFCDELTKLQDLKGILCLTSSSTLCPDGFINAVAHAFPDVPIFGSVAGSPLMSEDLSAVFAQDRIMNRGIVAVALCGSDLHLWCDYTLGWRPIGKGLTVTSYAGGGVVRAIDGEPATSLYKRYLGVGTDEYFFANTCTFPLVVQEGERLAARTPLSYTADGALLFGAAIPNGTQVRLSYTKPEYLLQENLATANAVANFAPQGLLVFACQGRRVFLGNDTADREISYYSEACPTMAWAGGYAEILHDDTGGGLLNNSIAVIGLREGDDVPDTPHAPIVDPELRTQGTVIPLHERLVTFLEATTTELRATINELARLAERDQLTGLYNRRHMDKLIRYELSKRRTGDDLVLLMYDIDHFKQINDQYGHDVGDMVLRDLTEVVSDAVRTADTLSRWGGEEFLCLLAETSLKDGRMVAERIRQRVEQHVFDPVGQVTISIGVTSARVDDTLETLFARADKAMYDAKNGGRNCVRVR